LLKQKNEFIAQLSHDLKTPLTPLMGLLPSIAREEKDPKLKGLLEVSIRNVNYLRDLVSKTIDITRLDSNLVQFSIEDTTLLPEVEKVIDNNQFLLDDNEISVDNNIDEKIFVKADRLRLREIINNLVKNSIKYMPEDGGIITINAKEDKDFIVISVKDTGMGLTREQISHIFDEFYKVDPARSDLNSNGLCLPICKRLVEKQGGRIWAESFGTDKVS